MIHLKQNKRLKINNYFLHLSEEEVKQRRGQGGTQEPTQARQPPRTEGNNRQGTTPNSTGKSPFNFGFNLLI